MSLVSSLKLMNEKRHDNDQISVKKYGVDPFDSELMNERSDLSKKKNAVDLFHNTSMASGITLDSTFSNLLKDFIIRTLV